MSYFSSHCPLIFVIFNFTFRGHRGVVLCVAAAALLLLFCLAFLVRSVWKNKIGEFFQLPSPIKLYLILPHLNPAFQITSLQVKMFSKHFFIKKICNIHIPSFKLVKGYFASFTSFIFPVPLYFEMVLGYSLNPI